MNDGYTPTTEQVRTEWVESAANPSETNRLHSDAEFDRWLEAHDRQVAAKAWDEGHEQGYDSGRYAEEDDEPETVETRSLAMNPYHASGEVEIPRYDDGTPISFGPARCEVPPPGWWCSRGAGHDGPCAARPVELELPEVRLDTPERIAD